MAGMPIEIPEAALRDFCQVHGIRRMAVFGSAIREDFTPASDIDVLVELRPDAAVGLFGFAEMEGDLSEILGRRVDLKTPNGLSPYFRDVVLAEAQDIYVAA